DTTGKAKGNTDATADATATKNKNEADIKKKIDNADIKKAQGKKTAAEIAKAIKDAIAKATDPNTGKVDPKAINNAVKDATGIDLGVHKGTDITGVSVTAKPDGTIDITVDTNTKGANPPKGQVKGKLIGNNDKVVAATKAKDSHAADIKKKIDGVDIKGSQGGKTITDIVKDIKKAIKDATKPDGTVDIKKVIAAVKKATGVDLGTGQFGKNPVTDITSIDVKGNPDGTIDVTVKTHTKGASPEDKTVTGKLKGNTDAAVKANTDQPKNTAAISAAFKNASLKHQGTRTIAEVIKDILKGKNPAGILANIKTETGGVAVAVTSNGTTITKVSLAVNAAGDGIDVTIETNTPNATIPTQTVKVVVKGESNAAIATKKADILQKNNNQKISDIINKTKIDGKKQGTKSVADIAKAIADAKKKPGWTPKDLVDAVKKATGIDLSKGHKGTDITDIDVTTKPDGTVDIKVSTSTKGASKSTGSTTGTTHGKDDKTVANEKADENKAFLKKIFKSAKLIDQRNRKSSDVIAEIKANYRKRNRNSSWCFKKWFTHWFSWVSIRPNN
ncbi:hypothetical protein, partial [Mycoplasma todarodis]